MFVKQGESGKTEKVIDESVNNDLLIAPTYQIRRTKRGAFSEEVCARVIGYRGVVAGFEDSKRIRSTDPNYRGSPDVYLDQIEGGKAKLLRRLTRQGYKLKVEVPGLQTLGLKIAGGNLPRDSWGRYSL